MKLTHYRQLKVWEKAISLVENIYQATSGFPDHEKFALVSQLRRAAVSIPSNIAEGHARRSTRDYARFISMALGSLAEVETQIEIAARLGYLNDVEGRALTDLSDEIGKMLRAIEIRLRPDQGSRVSESIDPYTSP